jgi:hypothetical protein
MGFKSCLTLIQRALSNPAGYEQSSARGSISVAVGLLVQERTKIKREMSKIVDRIDKLSVCP